MALIKCVDCGTEVSERAPTCPKCGGPVGAGVQPAAPAAPVQARKSVPTVLVLLLLVVGAVVAAGFHYGWQLPGSNSQKAAFDPMNLDHVKLVSAALEAPGTPECRAVLQRYGIYDENGNERSEAMTAYGEAVSRWVRGERKDEWFAFRKEINAGGWKAYIASHAGSGK